MSNLLSQASLVMIPSGYKEDIVYSAVPTNGNGDLSFTRASNGTRINSAGLVEVVAWNLVQNSENFSSGWTGVNNTITANSTTAPNGTTTADTFTLTPSGDSSIYQPVNGVSNNYTISVYAKYVSGDKYLYLFSPLNSERSKVWFDIQNGTVSNQLSGYTGTIESVGNGWYRCSMYNTTASVLDYIQFGISTTNSSRTLSNNSVSYFWGAQINVGTAKPYFPTTDRLNVPRLTYQNGGGGCPSLLLEKQSTNLVTWSEDLSNADWTKGSVTITANNSTSPDGTQNADRVVETSAGGQHLFYENITVTNGATYTLTAFYKAQERTAATLQLADGASRFTALFDLSAGTILTTRSLGSPSGTSSSITNMGNGWYRCSITMTQAVGTTMIPHGALSNSNTPTWDIYDFPIYTGNSANGLLASGFQLEASSYATSYIVSTSSSATRVADACIKTGISSLIGQTEGTMFVDLDLTHINSGSNEYLAQIRQDSSNRILLYRSSSNSSIGVVVLNAGGTIFSNLSSVTGNTKHKVAIAYKSGDLAFYIDGVQIATNSTTFSAYSSLSAFDLGNNSVGGTPVELGDYNYNQAILFPTRLTNAELASLTTI